MGVVPPVETGDMTHSMCGPCAERLRRQELGPRPQVLVVVRSVGLAAGMTAAFAALQGVAVVPDRREGQRRREQNPVSRECRQLDRRRSWASQRDPWSVLGIQVVPIGKAGPRAPR